MKLTKSIIIIITLSLFACTSKESKKIPLDTLDINLKNTGDQIVKDVLESIAYTETFADNKGAGFLLNKHYTTPKLHGGIKKFSTTYDKAYFNINRILGKITSYELFEVIDKGIIKSMRYKLEVEAEDIKFVELKLDVNRENNLVAFYLYLSSVDGRLKRQNVLPEIKMTY